MRAYLWTTTAMVATMTAGGAEAADPARTAILKAARPPAEEAVGQPVRFLVKRLQREGDWVFLLATMQDSSGRSINLRHTPLAALAEHGAVSDDYAALLKHNGRSWTVIVHLVGPTDEGWLDWPSRYGAPERLFLR